MEWYEVYPPGDEPTLDQISEFINTELWNQVDKALVEEFKTKRKLEYSGCSLKGWNIKYKKSGRNLCTIYPYKDYFKLLVVIPEIRKDEAELFLEFCTDEVKAIYKVYDYFNGGKWMIIDVTNKKILKDALGLIEIRNRK